MKRIKQTICFSIFSLGILAQSVDQNYILTRTYQNEMGTSFLDQIQYFDGLGRLIETVQKGITPKGKNLVTLTEYDGFGREYKHWLPVPAPTNTGAYVSTADFANFASIQYESNEVPYSTIEYEPSPLNRVTGQFGVGSAWININNPKKVKTDYQSNTSSEVVYYFVNNARHLQRTGFYNANTLFKTEVTDEDNKSVTEYKDKLGQVVMTRNSTNVNTYFVYNDFGELCFVIPPIAADELTNDIEITDTNSPHLKHYCYLYQYDERGNCIYKRLPGCAPIYMVYDRANRLVLSQDGNQRKKLSAASMQWTVNKYDAFGRIIFTGTTYRSETDTTTNYQTIRNLFKNDLIVETCTNGVYSNSKFPEATPLTVNYYDNYNFLPNLSTRLAYQQTAGYDKAYPETATLASDLNAATLLTGVCNYLLDGSGNSLASTQYYDYKGLVVQTRNTHLSNRYQIAYNRYDFTGKILETKKINGYSAEVPEIYKYYYDRAGRLNTTQYTLWSNSQITLSTNTYDELGRLITKKRHNGTDTETYSYNIRNWTTNITSGSFQEDLYYTNNPRNINGCFNGNISYSTWTYNNASKGYSYQYDGLNRLTSAISQQGTSTQAMGYFAEYFSYNKMGSITALFRKKDNIYIDNLRLNYANGNQVTSVSDLGVSLNSYATKEFQNKANVTNEMTYDANGNMIKDLNRDIVTIKYNILNLPDLIQFKNGNQIINYYTSDGRKVRTEYLTRTLALTQPLVEGDVLNQTYTAGSVDQIGLFYMGEFEVSTYKGNINQGYVRLYNPEGYTTTLPDAVYNYYRRDHLGNIRETWCGNTNTTIQKTQYYPSGLPWTTNSGDNPATQAHKYNGKEFVEMHGYDTYDYGARGLFPAIGSFSTVDPLCEKYYSISPYAYCAGNPVNRIDPDGMDWFYYSKDGKGDPTWNWRDESSYHTGVNDINGNEFVLQGQKAVVTAAGSIDEKAGKNGNMFSADSKLANFTVYGPGGKEDIKQYRGLTMTSDFSKYGAIENGEYEVYFRDPGKSKAPYSNWAINNTNAVNCLFGENRSPDGYSKTQKNGVYFHSTLSNNGRLGSRTSTGCILIVPSGHGENGWSEFNTQLTGISSFHFVLNRTSTVPLRPFSIYPLQGANQLKKPTTYSLF